MIKFNQFLEKELNNSQLQAVTNKIGPQIVIAGAGSGKTRVITARIANLILNENVEPNSVVALTFTNKAANEMKKRLIHFLNNKIDLPFVGTFHAYCLLLLRSNPTLIKYPKFTILDGDDQKTLIKKIIKRFGLEKQFSTADVLYQISNLKNKLNIDFEEFTTPIIKKIYLEYESEKRKSHSFDFDDLILTVLNIFRNNKEFKQHFQKKVRHILIDEYQDTNMVQHELLRFMSLDNKKKFKLDSLCAVGDEDQSIYSWRGAIATNMQKFQKDFKPVTLVKIEQNYRSVQPILQAANEVIQNNRKRTHKELWSNKKAQNRILSVSCRSGKQEANSIANLIKNLEEKKSLNNIAILYRTHHQSRNIEEALLNNSIPYKIIGGLRFYERKEIKDLLAYLRLIVNPYDRVSFLRIINCPPRGLGSKFEELVLEQWNINPFFDFKQLLKHLTTEEKQNLTPNKIISLQNFLVLYKKLESYKKPSDQIEEILEEIEYLKYLQKHHDQRESETKIDNVKEFVQSIYNFEKENTVENLLEEFLYQITLMQEKNDDKENKENQVQCMTLHAVKGLEFDTVIIAGLEEGLLPSSRSLNTNKDLEEERRLFYVGMTRAKEHLILFHANNRSTYGQISDQVISRFLTEIPDKLLKEIDISENNLTQINLAFKNWLGIKGSSVLTFHDFANNLAKNMEFTATKKAKTKKVIRRKIKGYFSKKTQYIKPSKSSTWNKNQPVQHVKFGVGIIKNVEKKDAENYYLTITFKSGEKKILSSFLKKI